MDVTGGGQPQVICEVESIAGGTWNSEGIIVFDQHGKPLQRVSVDGGSPAPILTLDTGRQEAAQNAPYFLPDGLHLVYLSSGKRGSNVMLASLDGKLNRVLIEGYAIATYAPNPRGGGWILYNNPRSQLLVKSLDLDKLEFTGEPAAIADGVGIGRWWYASATGLLAFRHSYGTQYQLTWFGRDGHPQGTVGDPGLLAAPRISPDQKTVAFQRTDAQNTDIWTFDLTRNTSTRFTFEPGPEAAAVWSFDGKSIFYGSGRSTSPNMRSIIERSADGVGQETLVVAETGSIVTPTAVSRDGLWLVFDRDGIVIRSRQDANKSIRIQDSDSGRDGFLSPDGRWLLYSTVPANRREVLVQAVPKEVGGSAVPGKWQISTAGGGQPAWRADGREIFFVAPDGMMMAVPVESGEDVFRAGAPKPLFQSRLEFDPGYEINRFHRQYDVTADGQRFLLNQHVADATDAPITVVVNWPKLLEKH
jgi:Tol biopolymer transport system component